VLCPTLVWPANPSVLPTSFPNPPSSIGPSNSTCLAARFCLYPSSTFASIPRLQVGGSLLPLPNAQTHFSWTRSSLCSSSWPPHSVSQNYPTLRLSHVTRWFLFGYYLGRPTSLYFRSLSQVGRTTALAMVLPRPGPNSDLCSRQPESQHGAISSLSSNFWMSWLLTTLSIDIGAAPDLPSARRRHQRFCSTQFVLYLSISRDEGKLWPGFVERIPFL